MGVDLSYHAYSPSLADQNWEHFPEDILLLRKKYQDEKEYEKQQEEAGRPEREKHEAKLAEFEKALAEKTKEIFKRYEDEGLFISEVDWNQDEPAQVNGVWHNFPTNKEKMEYMLVYGHCFQKDMVKAVQFPLNLCMRKTKSRKLGHDPFLAISNKLTNKKS